MEPMSSEVPYSLSMMVLVSPASRPGSGARPMSVSVGSERLRAMPAQS
jgi:hypothetical protein